MKKFIIILLFFNISCSSTQKNDSNLALAEELKLLREEINNLKKGENPVKNNEESEELEENSPSDIKFNEYSSNKKINESMTHQIALGEHYGMNIKLYISNIGSFWINFEGNLSDNQIEEVSLLIPHADRSPEFLNFINIEPNIFETKGDPIKEKTSIHLKIKIKNKKNIVFNLEVE